MKKISSNKSFGILFFIVFALISIWPLIQGGSLRIWPIPIALLFLILGLINSKLLNPLNIVWVKFGELLGRIIAPIVMSIIYFFIITPIGLFMRLIGKDLLKIKFSNRQSYWTKREKNIGPMKRQF
jgi:predicted membrane metal-binding protein